MKSMLNKAADGEYAVGAFNILDYNSTRALISGAEQLKAPVIIQTSAKTVIYWGAETIINWIKELTSHSKVPVALHLDHCEDLDLIMNCIDTGWTSVMIDASSKPFEENIALSTQVIDMARPNDVSVEIELGAILGVEDDIDVRDQDAHLADPDLSVEICRKVKPDCFAPAIGTAHGVYKGIPKIDYLLLEDIAKNTNIPIALHGGTGLTDEVFHKCISLGCAKVNISTQLKYAFIDGFVNYHNQHNTEYNPLRVIDEQFEQIKAAVIDNISLFGSPGKA